MASSFPFQLTNGRYQVGLTTRGGGASLLDWIALNRWAGDVLNDSQGFFLYLRDLENDALWSAALQPVMVACSRFAIRKEPDKIISEHEYLEILATVEISIDAHDDVERRVLRLRNLSNRIRRIEVTSCVEVALAHPAGDLSHPAFSKLFVQTELAATCGALIAKRRARSEGERWPALYHALSGAPTLNWETDRLRFVGRGRTMKSPALSMGRTVGNVLDPLLSLRTCLELQPQECKEITFILGADFNHAGVAKKVARHAPDARLEYRVSESEPAVETPRISGGFDPSGQEYLLRLPWTGNGLALPPMPWCNVIANERFGFITSETGAGCTWSRNSQANRLTPWSNDPVCDPHGEALYLRDEDNGEFWSPLPGPCPAAADYEAAYGFGYSRWSVTAHQLEHETTVCVPRADPVKLLRVRLHNLSSRPRHMSLFSYHQLVLGTLPSAAGPIGAWNDGSETLFAKSTQSGDFADGTVFCYSVFRGGDDLISNFTLDQRAFIGDNGNVRAPQALRQPHLDNAPVAPGASACFGWQWNIHLQAGETMELSLVFGEAVGDTELQALCDRYRNMDAVDAALAEVSEFWRELLGGVHVQTPSPEIDHMVNGWLGYQALACRIWARTAYYQSSGACGFRDQLQDAGNLTLLWPALTRRQILLHARHQFTEGDVLHWWHDAPVEKGIRTRFSDDLLWLPFVTSSYLQATGDLGLLDESIPFLEAPILQPGEDERYLKAGASDAAASLYEHCCLAIDRSLTRGAHELPLMGTGDWNDGMNRVGHDGRGESVWLGFFLHDILGHFIPLVRQRGEAERAEKYEAYRAALQIALNDSGWDGAWYRRAYFDEGTPLGTHTAAECRIDGLAQAWAVLSGAAPEARARMAMAAVEEHLISEREGLVRLLTPPFVDCPQDPGYIKGYVAGVRENGGQYTHAACWVVSALAKLGRRDRAARILAMLSPLQHSRTTADIQHYKTEPFVIAADIYGAPPHVGRGGWTWYTGSAGWAFRVAIESILGLRVQGGNLLILKPCVPDDWASYQIKYRHPESQALFEIEVQNLTGNTECVVEAAMDGEPVPVTDGTARLPIPAGGGTFKVRVRLGAAG